MKNERAMPPLQWRAVGFGLAIALLVGLMVFSIGGILHAPVLGVFAPLVGCASGGFLAGMLAKQAGTYHGAAVGAGWIVLEIIGAVPSFTGSGLPAAQETLVIIVLDVVLLGVAAVAGWLATRR